MSIWVKNPFFGPQVPYLPLFWRRLLRARCVPAVGGGLGAGSLSVWVSSQGQVPACWARTCGPGCCGRDVGSSVLGQRGWSRDRPGRQERGRHGFPWGVAGWSSASGEQRPQPTHSLKGLSVQRRKRSGARLMWMNVGCVVSGGRPAPVPSPPAGPVFQVTHAHQPCLPQAKAGISTSCRRRLGRSTALEMRREQPRCEALNFLTVGLSFGVSVICHEESGAGGHETPNERRAEQT